MKPPPKIYTCDGCHIIFTPQNEEVAHLLPQYWCEITLVREIRDQPLADFITTRHLCESCANRAIDMINRAFTG